MNNRYKVFFDFDNTITSFDVLDDVIKRFSVNGDWVKFENAWASGEIGSKECLRGQLRSLRVRKKDLLAYLSRIKIDGYFVKILDLLKEKGIEPVIVSDSFSFLIKTILEKNGINGNHNLKIYANQLRFKDNRLIPYFPHSSPVCSDCGNCKKMHVLDLEAGRRQRIYIGDGRSDLCAAEHADVVFAKGALLRHLRNRKKGCREFNSLRNVYRYLKEVGDAT